MGEMILWWQGGMVREKSVVAASKHLGRKISHDGFGLDVEITEHFVRSPASNEPNPISVNVGTEKCHGAGCPKGAGRDIRGHEAVEGSKDSDRRSKEVGEDRRCDAPEAQGLRVKIGGQGLGGCCTVRSQMKGAAGGRPDWAKVWVATATETDDFAAHAVLLRGEFEGDKGRCEELVLAGRSGREWQVAEREAYI